MSSKSKKQPATVVPKPKYANGQKVFICCYVFSGPGKILQGEITRVDAFTHLRMSDSGKIVGNETFFGYIIHTSFGDFDTNERNVYPSYFHAANEFGKIFVEYLK